MWTARLSPRVGFARLLARQAHERSYYVSLKDAQRWATTAGSLRDYAASWQEWSGDGDYQTMSRENKTKYHDGIKRAKNERREKAVTFWTQRIEFYKNKIEQWKDREQRHIKKYGPNSVFNTATYEIESCRERITAARQRLAILKTQLRTSKF